MRQNQKQDRVRFGYDREDNIIEDLNTLSALYDEIQSNVNSLHQWVPILVYLGDIHIFFFNLTVNWIKLDQTRSNKIKPEQIDFIKFNVPTYVVTVPTVNMFFP